MLKQPRLSRVVFVLATVFFAAGCVTERSPVTGEKQRLAFSWEQEKELGRKSDQEITTQMGAYDSEDLQAYVDHVAERVLQASDFSRTDLPKRYRDTTFTFRILDNRIVNAFALPGGYVYVTRGLLAHVENEAQLAVVLGHEIGHVAARHSAQRALKQQWSQIGLIAGVLVGSQVLGGGAQDLFQLGGTAMQLLLNSYSRENEREADRLGVRYAAAAGYAAAEGAGFFVTLDRKSQAAGAALPSWQSTHPDPGEREATIRRLAQEFDTRYEMTTVGTDALMTAIDGLVVGSDPRQGIVLGGSFLHPVLDFQFDPPAGWRVQNQAQAVLMGHPDQQAMLTFEITPGDTPAAAAAQLKQEGQLQVVREGDFRIDGLNAYFIEGRANAQDRTLALMFVFVELDQRVYAFSGYTAAAEHDRYIERFAEVARSFGPLQDRAILNAQPHRLETFRARDTRLFSAYVPPKLPPELDAQTLAIMNQTEIDDATTPGTWLKLPQAQPTR